LSPPLRAVPASSAELRRSGGHASPAPSRRRARLELAVAAIAVLLLSTVLYQPPLAEVRLSGAESHGLLVRSWDLVWVLLAGVALWAGFTHRAELRAAIARRQIPWRDPIFAIAVLAAFATLSLGWLYLTFETSGLSGSVIRCFRLVSVVVLALTLRVFLTERLRTATVFAFLGLSVAAAVWAFVAWREKGALYQLGLRSVPVGVTRAGGPFGNQFASTFSDSWWAPSGAANALGLWLAVALPICVVSAIRLLRAERRWSGLLSLFAVVPLTGGLIATHSRESWAACLAGLAVLWWVGRRKESGARKTLATLTMLAAVAAAVAVAVPSATSRISASFTPGTFEYKSGPQARIDAWGDGLKWSWERFPVGWGVGAIEQNPEYFDQRTTFENIYIQQFAQLGLVGLLALAAIVAQGLRLSVRSTRARPGDLSALYATAFFSALAVHGMFGNSLGDPTIQILLAMALAYCVKPGTAADTVASPARVGGVAA
jgi:O-antigen ligase/polysaccharide polymerase Wzy-like membrane protein